MKLTKYDPKLVTAYNNLKEFYNHVSLWKNSLKYLEHAFEMRLKGMVAMYTDLAVIYYNLGCIYVKRKQLIKAIEMLQKALKIDN